MPKEYRKLSVDTVKEYVLKWEEHKCDELWKRLGVNETTSHLQVTEVGDGNLNYVYILKGSNGSVVAKQAVPYIRLVGEGWPLTRTRAFYEANAMKEHHKHSPYHVPGLIHYDDDLSLIFMDHLANHIVLRRGLIQGIEYPNLAKDMGNYLGRVLFKTSGLGMITNDKKKMVSKYCGNYELCSVTEKVIFNDPYLSDCKDNHWTKSVELNDLAKEIQSDPLIKVSISELLEKFQQSTQALIHADLHTGSVMVSHDETFVIDYEFAFYGPMGFDTGAFIANLFLSYFSQNGHSTTNQSRDSYKKWLLNLIKEFWDHFTNTFFDLWEKEHSGDLYSPSFYGNDENGKKALRLIKEEFINNLFIDTIGFASAKIIRRIFGIAHVADMEDISDTNLRSKCEVNAINFAKELLLHRKKKYHDISSVIQLAIQKDN